MEFIKDQEKRILLSAISREKKVIEEHKELAELIPVINQLDYYFMYDRLFKQIYSKGFMDGVNDTVERYKDSTYKKKYDSELLNKVHVKLCDEYFTESNEEWNRAIDRAIEIIKEIKEDGDILKESENEQLERD